MRHTGTPVGTEGTRPMMPGTDGLLGGSVQRPRTKAVWDPVEVGAKWGVQLCSLWTH